MYTGPIKIRVISPISIITIIFLIAGFNSLAFSQMTLTGKIKSKGEESPIPYATIGVKGKNAGTVADAKGRFHLYCPHFVKQTDTVVITSIGFQSLEIPVNGAVGKEEFEMEVEAKELPPVSVFTFFNQHFYKTVPGEESFFRGWYSYKTGGEIGNIIDVPHRVYKIDKILFKVDNKYDTCLIRLHIRKIENGWPAGELLTEDIIIPVFTVEVDFIGQIDDGHLDVTLGKLLFNGLPKAFPTADVQDADLPVLCVDRPDHANQQSHPAGPHA